MIKVMSDFTDYILSSSDAACRQIMRLDRAISDASGVLSGEDKLKIMIEVAFATYKL